MPALPVTAIIFADEFFLFNEENFFKKLISLETLIVLFLKFFIFLDETIYFAPLLRALPANFTPSLFFPFIVKNKLFFVTCLESIANP